jgi:hypothetical protein
MARCKPPPPALDPTEWVPFNEALKQIKPLAGNAALAVRDLQRGLRRDPRSGGLVGASRCLSGNPERETREIHKRAFWRNVEVREFDGRVRVRPLSSDPHHPLFNGRWVF